jgi:fumarate hydratase subunit alpha
MRKISAKNIGKVIEELCLEANFVLREDIFSALKIAYEKEDLERARTILSELIENAALASREKLPLCQDTGFIIIFLKLGQEVIISGGDLTTAINKGIREGYRKGYLRKSVCHPLTRQNTGDNIPAVIHTEIIPGNKLKIVLFPKGFGSENASKLQMFEPTAGTEKIKKFIVDSVAQSGINSCPPLIIGIGIGGTADKATLLSKRALLRTVGSTHEEAQIGQLEKELLDEINALGIGPAGLGGKTTALAVHIETYPTHIAGLPVAINISCHALRQAERIL